MVLSKHVTHYGPRLGFPTPNRKGSPYPITGNAMSSYVGLSPGNLHQYQTICMRQKFLDIYWTLKLSLEQWNMFVCLLDGVYRHFRQYFSYIVAVSFIGGGNWRTQRKPSTCRKSLTNFYHIMLYTSRFELTTPVVLHTGCIGSLNPTTIRSRPRRILTLLIQGNYYRVQFQAPI